MKRIIKTMGIITTMGIIAVGAYLLGTTQAEIKTEVRTITENYVDMRKVTYFEVEDGLQLYYEDGSGYYWE